MEIQKCTKKKAKEIEVRIFRKSKWKSISVENRNLGIWQPEMWESQDGNPEMQKIEIQRSRNQKCGKVEMEIQRCRNSKCAQAGKAAGKIEDLRFTDQRAALMI